ncbi:MAG TPA: type II toxin-antitoxin system HicB family antitoxin [Isosphaeraceae bacterium]|nr:type II toxin-antitoxin system HicB family antitoxin [Isosphaeraceae bacterium]
MPSTLSIPFEIRAEVHEIEGGGFWAKVPCFPGCVTQAETLEDLKEALTEAVEDWLYGEPVKTEEEARRLAEIQGAGVLMEPGPFPLLYPYQPPDSWTDEDE